MESKVKITKALKQTGLALKPLELDETNVSLVIQKFKDLKLVGKAIKEQLVDTVDYYTLPDSDKPALSKVGAVKIGLAFNLTSKNELVDKVEDRTSDVPYFQYTYKCTMFYKNIAISESTASCNTMENQWGKAKDNPYQIISNCMLKAQKRAFVQAMLLISNVGEIFTAEIDEIKAKKELENIGQKQLMILYTMTPVDKEKEDEKKKQRKLRCKEICKEYSKKYNENVMSYPEITKSKYEEFKTFLKDYRIKWQAK